ncbi:hypothetical protein Y032_0011g1242 [Ancylostoma ceylanicum]|uniref:Uncharacterized protein n=1 Tax=Ancylostoma ceylanicum TaxID=53326 RepID=A0A016VDM1_9BILA|nr:hypothetical protein Y032_0011g1242 [Ancylostoma ceylanicum]
MEWIGLFAAVFASVLFGSVFVPIKRVAAGDGFTAQLFMCIGAFMAAAVVHASLYFPPVYGFAMISGTLWCTANAFAIQIINRLGLALSVLVWNTVSCLTGWATSRYGLFGLPPAIPASTVLNYLGIIGLIAGPFPPLLTLSEREQLLDFLSMKSHIVWDDPICDSQLQFLSGTPEIAQENNQNE